MNGPWRTPMQPENRRRLLVAFWITIPFYVAGLIIALRDQHLVGHLGPTIAFFMFAFAVLYGFFYVAVLHIQRVLLGETKTLRLKDKSKVKVCPYCKSEIGELRETLRCSWCGTFHHAECWSALGRCSVFNCPGRTTIGKHRGAVNDQPGSK